MSKIHLKTIIKADIETVFDLARDIDLHQKSASQTNETAVAGKTSGLIKEGKSVTWRAKHLGFYQTHTSKIIEMQKSHQFTDLCWKERLNLLNISIFLKRMPIKQSSSIFSNLNHLLGSSVKFSILYF
ncbi:hypothetical protein [Chryseobacterium binzhouense]|uniref:hypothetical protein n=1 Tax=Chryseobacterium binzhouense TaxID=2593646 RepID=UPI0028969A73|nr:hypothetical protein [Chryseobacterium binzhouense]